MRFPHFQQLHQINSAGLADEARRGLAQQPASVSPKFLYDALGSRLFDAITELPEYYPTRTEAAILGVHSPQIAAAVRDHVGSHPALVDLGAGNCVKAARLFDALTPSRYVAVDISVDFLHQALECLQRQYPDMAMDGVGLDFSSRLTLPAGLVTQPAVVFYPGSSIGNFSHDDALRLLREARELSAGGCLLIGVDLVKPVELLVPAYDDELGVTGAFNLNLLCHLNRLVGSDFSVRDWQHVALFNPGPSRIEMHLQSRRAQTVHWHGGERRFAAGERIHTENSYKWRLEDFEALLRRAGYAKVHSWTDPLRWFAVVVAGAG